MRGEGKINVHAKQVVYYSWQGRVLLRLLPDSRTNVQRKYNLAQLEVSDID